MNKDEKPLLTGFRMFRTTLRKSWNLFKRSKLGLAGTAIIGIFVFLAIFAPIVAPYTPEYLAPNVDVFEPVNFLKTYEPLGNFSDQLIAPSSPNDPSQPKGRLWTIMAYDSGIIQMDAVSKNETPFDPAQVPIVIDIKAFGLNTPLSNLLYLTPGRTRLGRLMYYDDLSRNGLLAFVANRQLVLMNPFENRIYYRQDIGFQPKWFVQDPVSAGDMYDFPMEDSSNRAYRYIVATNDTRLTIFRVNYRSSQDTPAVRSVDRLADVNMTVIGTPLAYYLRLQKQLSAIFVPTSGNRLTAISIDATYWTNLTMTIENESAYISANIGYIRATEVQMLYVPLKSVNKTGIAYLLPRNTNQGNYTIEHMLVINNPTAVVTTQPDPGNANTPHFVVTYYDNGNATRSDMLRGSRNGTLDPILNVSLESPIKDFFYSPTTSQVMALDTSGTVWTAPTVTLTSLRQGLAKFFADVDPERERLLYMGSWGGTKYNIYMSSEEIFAYIFEPNRYNVTVFKLLGSSIAPLPPGSYPSGNTYYLGTDDQGHDILTQLIYGSRIALLVGVLAALFAVIIGTLVGLIAGFYGGLLDTILMRLTDIALVLPFLPLVLILAAILGPNIANIIIVVAFLSWPGIARVIRAQTLSLKERPFVDAARISGASRSRTMMVHVAPNVLPFAFLYMTLLVGGAILTEAAVSFLGLGDPNPNNVSWGIMLRTLSSSGNTLTAWWWLLPPGLCITLVSLGFYLVGRAIDDIINPRLRER